MFLLSALPIFHASVNVSSLQLGRSVLSDYAEWYRERFDSIQPQWYVFPFGEPTPSDPSRPVTTLKTAWNNVRKKAKVTGRWHDHRHTMITDLAESGAGDQTIMDIAGHVSKSMLKHYSHIRMEAKRDALESLVKRTSPEKSMPRSTKKSKFFERYGESLTCRF
jgi:integrase